MKEIKQFWNWVVANKQRLLQIDKLGNYEREKLLNELIVNLHNYCSELYFEIGGNPESRNLELIITADGNKQYFDHVFRLVENAPQIESLKITALKPPSGIKFETDFEGLQLEPASIWFLPLEHKLRPKEIGIKICIPDFESHKNNQWLKSAVIKMVETVIGEKSIAEDIQFIDIDKLPYSPEEDGLIELEELARYISWKKKKLGLSGC